MHALKVAFAGLLVVGSPVIAGALPPGGGSISGKVTFSGTLPKPKPLDVSKEPDCVKLRGSNPLFPENVLTGAGNTLRNVVVYISSGATDYSPVPTSPAIFDQEGCHYATHVLAFRVGQEVKISNSDPISHNIHPLAKINREWNKIQPPGTPPFSYAYDREEIIQVKCNIHPWMQGYFVILKTHHFSVTGDDGHFHLPDVPPGHYTVTAWHETFGTINKDVTVTGTESLALDFNFSGKP